MKPTPLKPEWQLFVAEYLIDLNATRAVQRAGLAVDNVNTAAVMGCHLLRKPKIQRAIRSAFKSRMKRIELKQDRVLQELALIAFSDVLDYEVNERTGRLVPLTSRRASKAVQSVRVRRREWKGKDGNLKSEVVTELKLWDKLRALELLMKHMGMMDGEYQPTQSIEQRRLEAGDKLRQMLLNRRSSQN